MSSGDVFLRAGAVAFAMKSASADILCRQCRGFTTKANRCRLVVSRTQPDTAFMLRRSCSATAAAAALHHAGVPTDVGSTWVPRPDRQDCTASASERIKPR
jgi:hypothetical protein